MRKILIAAPLIFCLYLPGYAQEDTSVFETVTESYDVESRQENNPVLVSPEDLKSSERYQSQELKPRKFDEEKWKTIVKGVNYDEGKDETLNKPDESSPWGGKILKFLSYAVIAALLFGVLYYVTRVVSFDFKIQRTKLETEDLKAPLEDIAELDIEQLLEQAKREGNYKLAVRLYYLGLLKQLNDKGAIVWKKDKTNRDYLGELFSANLFFDEVRKLTLSYEAVWYGDHELERETYLHITSEFETIYGKINTSAKA